MRERERESEREIERDFYLERERERQILCSQKTNPNYGTYGSAEQVAQCEGQHVFQL